MVSSALDGLPAGWTGTRVASTGSTNADLLAAAATGAPHGTVLAADEQTAGRGRLGRAWVTPAGTALAVSVLLRPPVEPAAWGWLPLLAGMAVGDALAAVAPALAVGLKWPNDVLVPAADGREPKLAGTLAEVAGGTADRGAVVVGIGLNVTTPATAFAPGVVATSLAAEGVSGAALDRGHLLVTLLGALAERYGRWAAAAGPADLSGGLAAGYSDRCTTLGRAVEVHVGGGTVLAGVAVGIGPDGALLVRAPDAPDAPVLPVRAGDVRHLQSGIIG